MPGRPHDPRGRHSTWPRWADMANMADMGHMADMGRHGPDLSPTVHSTLAGLPPTGLNAPRRPHLPPPGPPPDPGAAPVKVKCLSICAAGNRRVRGPSEPVLPCTRNDYFLQKVRSRLRKTSKNDNVQASALPGRAPRKPSRGQPGTNASRTAKTILPPVQVKRLSILHSWKLEGLRALRTGAPVHAKRQLSPKGTLSST